MMTLSHYIPQNYPSIQREFIEPVPDDYFIYWLFKYKCVVCKKPATEINEIIPRGRSKKSVLNWKNRVAMCHECHMGDNGYHHKGVTQKKIEMLQAKRKEFLISMGRKDYV